MTHLGRHCNDDFGGIYDTRYGCITGDRDYRTTHDNASIYSVISSANGKRNCASRAHVDTTFTMPIMQVK